MSGFLDSLTSAAGDVFAGIVKPFTPTTDNSADDVMILVGDAKTQIGGWESVSIQVSAIAYPRAFTISMAEPDKLGADKLLAPPGSKVTVLIGGDPVVTGYIDRYVVTMSDQGHRTTIMGRGLGGQIMDCSADLLSPSSPVVGGSISAANILDLAQKMVAPFHIKVIAGQDSTGSTVNLGKPIPIFQVALGETPWEVISKAARYVGILVYEDGQGNMVLNRVGNAKMASGVSEGANLEGGERSFSIDQRFSIYTAVWSTTDQLTEGADQNVYNRHGQATDPGVPLYRPHIFLSQQTQNGTDLGQQLATWEMQRRRGGSEQVTLTCDSWRDQKKALWDCNKIIPVFSPNLKLPQSDWVIVSCNFLKDEAGTHATMLVMPPESLSVQPAPLNAYDNEIRAAQAGDVPAAATQGAGDNGPANKPTGPGA